MAKKEPQESTATEAQSKGARGPGTIALALALAIGLAVGGGAGAFVAGPLLAKRIVHDIDTVARVAGNSYVEHLRVAAEASQTTQASHAGSSVAVHTINNLVVNPARSNGTRYLLLSLSLAVSDEASAAELQERDSEVRDAVIGVLGQKGVAELSSHESREALKAELGEALNALLKREAVQAVYFPQYVIQ